MNERKVFNKRMHTTHTYSQKINIDMRNCGMQCMQCFSMTACWGVCIVKMSVYNLCIHTLMRMIAYVCCEYIFQYNIQIIRMYIWVVYTYMGVCHWRMRVPIQCCHAAFFSLLSVRATIIFTATAVTVVVVARQTLVHIVRNKKKNNNKLVKVCYTHRTHVYNTYNKLAKTTEIFIY